MINPFAPNYDPQVELEKFYLWAPEQQVYQCRHDNCGFEAPGKYPMSSEHPSSMSIASHLATHHGPIAPDGLPWEGFSSGNVQISI